MGYLVITGPTFQVDRLEGQREELEVGLGDLPLVERQMYGMLKESVEASHPQGGSGEDLASLISSLLKLCP